MAKEIDERVVSMKFDNAGFQEKISGSISALQKLKESLNFKNAGKGLQDVNAAANGMNLSGIASAIDNISSKFSVMGAISLSVINSIVSAAVSAGASIVKAFTLAPLMQGFQEYETNMNSIQTILANTKSKGSNLGEVNAALDQLNEYSDKTIYNFSQMARNVGTFTAAGVGLEQSVNAIKGVANLAAISGSNSEQASTAMYQLSQALAAGKVNLMDWNSVVNAGMGGEIFKKALFETGKALGKINDVPLGTTFEEWEKKGGTFREQMSEGWLTSDVLSTTLNAFSGDLDIASLKAQGFSDAAAAQMVELGKLGLESATRVKTATQLMSTIKETVGSGFAQTFRTIIGDFEEAPKLFTRINEAVGGFIGKIFDAQHALLAGWRFLGGREKLIEALAKAFSNIGSILKKIGDAFREVFPAKTSADLAMMTAAFSAFIDRMKPSEQLLNTIKAGFRAFFSVISIGVEILKYIGRTFKIFFRELNDANGGQILTFLGEFAYKIIKLKETLVDGGAIRDFFVKYIYPIANFLGNLNIAGAIGSLISLLGDLFGAIKSFFGGETIDGEAVTGVVDRVGERFGWLSTVIEKLGQLGDWLKGKLSTIADAFKELLGKIAEVFSGTDTDVVFDALNTGLLAGLILLVRQFMKDGFKFDLGGGFFEKLSGSLEELTGVFTAMQQNLKAEALMKIAIAIGILTASILVLSLIDSAALTKALVAVATGFGILIGAMALLTKATAGLKSSGSFTILAVGLIALAAAMLIFSIAVKILSTMDTGELIKGLVGVVVLLGAVTLAVNNMPNEGKMLSTGFAMIGMAAGILVLSLAVAIMGSMDLMTLIQGIGGVAAVLYLLVIAVNSMPKEGKVLAAAVAMIAIGVALNIIAGAIAILGSMDLMTLVQGIGGIAAVLYLLVIAINSFPEEGRLLASAAAMLVMAVAINIMAGAIAILGSMGLGDLIQGLIGLAAALFIITVAMAAMSGVTAGAIGMIVAAGAILILATALKVLGGMSIASIITAIVAFAVALAVITIAAVLIQPALPALFGLASALLALGLAGALFGVAAILIASAIGILATAIKTLVEVGVEGAVVFAEAMPKYAEAAGKAIVAIVTEIANALPGIIAKLGESVGALLQVLIDQAPKFGEVISVLIQTMLKVIVDNTPDIIAAGFTLLIALLSGIRDNIGEIVNVVVDIITNFLNALAERMGDIVTAGMNLLVSLLQGIADNIGLVLDGVGNIIVAFIDGVAAQYVKIIAAGKDLVIQFLVGLGSAVSEIATAVTTLITTMLNEAANNWLLIVAAGANFVRSFLVGLTILGTEIGTSITTFITTMLDEAGKNWLLILAAGVAFCKTFLAGIVNATTEMADAAFDFLTNLMDSLATVIDERAPELRERGLNLARAILEGLTGIDLSEVVEWAKGLAGSVVDAVKGFFGINSPSKVFMEIGEGLIEGLVNGMAKTKPAEDSATSLGTSVLSAMQSAYKHIEAMPEFQPTITPVLDLSNVKAGAKGLNSLIGDHQIDPNVSFQRANAIVALDAQRTIDESPTQTDNSKEINFTQINNSPEALRTKDIYRQTKAGLVLVQNDILK